jgi:hypothetical protein
MRTSAAFGGSGTRSASRNSRRAPESIENGPNVYVAVTGQQVNILPQGYVASARPVLPVQGKQRALYVQVARVSNCPALANEGGAIAGTLSRSHRVANASRRPCWRSELDKLTDLS